MLYENLLNCVDVVNLNDNMSNNMLDVDLDSEISIDEVLKVLTKAKNGKAPGIDLIPVELYRNNLLLHVLHKLFNICFKFGKIPSVWCKKYLHLFQSVLHRIPGIHCLIGELL
jgi:hypothetical protein